MQESGGFRLIVRRGPQPNQTFDLNKDIITLGRDITNDIVINDPEVSRHHLRLTRGADGYNLEDLGSTNGTFISNQRISGVQALKRGEQIGLGETVTLVFEMTRPDAPAPSPQPQPQPQSDYASYQQPPQQGGYQAPGGYPQQQQQPVGGYYDPATPPPPPDYDYDQPAYEGGDYQGYGAGGSPSYDPYAIRDGGQASPWRWVIIGCAGLLLFCCCATVLGLVIIDSADLWCEIPIFKDVITPIFGLIGEALGVIDNARMC